MLFVTAVCDDLANTKTADRQPELRIITKCIQCKYWVYVVYFRLTLCAARNLRKPLY